MKRRKHSDFFRMLSAGTLCCFLMTGNVSSQGFAEPLAPPGLKQASAQAEVFFNPRSVRIPREFGRVESVYQGSSSQTVFLVQDAHEIPDAQRNIHNLIRVIQKKYGADFVGLEGASGKLDVQMFKSFPDKKRLKSLFQGYLADAELTGGIAAAVFNESGAYFGVEDWNLYTEAVQLYLKAMEQERELSSKLKVQSSRLEEKKKEVYSKELYELDKKLEKFFRGELDLVSAGMALGDAENGRNGEGERGERSLKPEIRNSKQSQISKGKSQNVSRFDIRNSDLQTVGSQRSRVSQSSRLNSFSSVAAFLKEIQNQHSDLPSLDQEVRRIAGEVRKRFEGRREKGDGRQGVGNKQLPRSLSLAPDLVREFNSKDQQYSTSQITPQAFALFLKEFAAKNGLKIKFSSVLSGGVEQQKTLRDLEGTTFLKEFEAYAKSVKESLMKNEEQKKLDAESRQLLLQEKLIKLELSREEWNEVKETRDRGQEAEDKRQETGEVENFLVFRPSSLAPFLNFYRNAEKRDEALLRNLLNHLPVPPSLSHPVSRSSILVAGGFHAQGITQKLREKNISYVLVMPEIKNVPKETNYREHMKGNVSWKKYLHPRKGWVEHYPAFVRGARDRLIGGQETRDERQGNGETPPRPPSPVSGPLLKSWRDQIIRDLADAGKVEQSGRYTKFLDELIVDQKESNSAIAEGLLKIRDFLEGLNQLRSQGKMQPENVLALFPRAAAASTPIASALSPGFSTPIRVGVANLSGISAQRSEARNSEPAGSNAPVIKVGKKKTPKKTSLVLEAVKIVAGGAGGLGIGAVILLIFGLGPFAKPSVQPPAKAPSAQVASEIPQRKEPSSLKQSLLSEAPSIVSEEKKSAPVMFPSPLHSQAPAANILTQIHWGAYSGSDAFNFPVDGKGVLNLSELNAPAQGWKMGWLAEPFDIYEYPTLSIEYENPAPNPVTVYLELKGGDNVNYFTAPNGKVPVSIPAGKNTVAVDLNPYLKDLPKTERYWVNLLGFSIEQTSEQILHVTLSKVRFLPANRSESRQKKSKLTQEERNQRIVQLVREFARADFDQTSSRKQRQRYLEINQLLKKSRQHAALDSVMIYTAFLPEEDKNKKVDDIIEELIEAVKHPPLDSSQIEADLKRLIDRLGSEGVQRRGGMLMDKRLVGVFALGLIHPSANIRFSSIRAILQLPEKQQKIFWEALKEMANDSETSPYILYALLTLFERTQNTDRLANIFRDYQKSKLLALQALRSIGTIAETGKESAKKKANRELVNIIFDFSTDENLLPNAIREMAQKSAPDFAGLLLAALILGPDAKVSAIAADAFDRYLSPRLDDWLINKKVGARSETREGEGMRAHSIRQMEVFLPGYSMAIQFRGGFIRPLWIDANGFDRSFAKDDGWIKLSRGEKVEIGRIPSPEAAYKVTVPADKLSVSRKHMSVAYDDNQGWIIRNLSSKGEIRLNLSGTMIKIAPDSSQIVKHSDLNPPAVIEAENIIESNFAKIVADFQKKSESKAAPESRMLKAVKGMLADIEPDSGTHAVQRLEGAEIVLRQVLGTFNLSPESKGEKVYVAALHKLGSLLAAVLDGERQEALAQRRLENERAFEKIKKELLDDEGEVRDSLEEEDLNEMRRELSSIRGALHEVGMRSELLEEINRLSAKLEKVISRIEKKQLDENVALHWKDVVKIEKWRIEKGISDADIFEVAWSLNNSLPVEEGAVLEPGYAVSDRQLQLMRDKTSPLVIFFAETSNQRNRADEFTARRRAVLRFYNSKVELFRRLNESFDNDLEKRQILAEHLFVKSPEERLETPAALEKFEYHLKTLKNEFPKNLFEESSELSGAPYIRILKDLLPKVSQDQPLSVGDEIEDDAAGVNRAIINQRGDIFTVREHNWREGSIEIKQVRQEELESLRSRTNVKLIRLRDRKDLTRSEAREVIKVSSDGEYRLENVKVRMQDYFEADDVIGETVLLADNTGTMVVNYGDTLGVDHFKAVKEMLSRGGAVIINSGDPLNALKNATYEALLKDLTTAEKQRFVIVADGGTTKLWFDQAGVEHIERMPEFPLSDREKFARALAAAFYDQLKQRQSRLKDLLRGVSDEEIDAVKSAGMQRLETIIAAGNWGKVRPGEGKYIFKLLPESWKEKWGDVFIYDTGAKVTVDTVKLRRDKIVSLEFTEGILQAIRPVTGENRDGLYAVSGPGFVDIVKLSKVEGVTRIFNEKILPQLDAAKKTIFLVVGDSDNDLPTFGFKIPETLQGTVLPVFLSHNEQYAASFSNQPYLLGRQNLEGSLDWIQAMNAVKGKTAREIDESGILNNFKIYRWVRNEQTDNSSSEAEVRSELRETVAALLGRQTPKLENAAAVVRIDREMGAEEFNRIFIEAALEVLGEDPFTQGLGDFVSKQENTFAGLMTRLGIEKFQLGFDAGGAANEGELKDYFKMMIRNKAYLERVLISSGTSRIEGIDEFAKNGVAVQSQRTVDSMVRSAQTAGDLVLAILFPHLDSQAELQKGAAPVGAEGVGDLTEVSMDAAERTLLFQAALLRAAYLKKAAALKESERLEPFETLLKQLSPALEMKQGSNSVTVNRSALKGILAAISQSRAAGKSA